MTSSSPRLGLPSNSRKLFVARPRLHRSLLVEDCHCLLLAGDRSIPEGGKAKEPSWGKLIQEASIKEHRLRQKVEAVSPRLMSTLNP
jgi:hypothetical protein